MSWALVIFPVTGLFIWKCRFSYVWFLMLTIAYSVLPLRFTWKQECGGSCVLRHSKNLYLNLALNCFWLGRILDVVLETLILLGTDAGVRVVILESSHLDWFRSAISTSVLGYCNQQTYWHWNKEWKKTDWLLTHSRMSPIGSQSHIPCRPSLCLPCVNNSAYQPNHLSCWDVHCFRLCTSLVCGVLLRSLETKVSS